jgi:hypothetical protein
MWRLRAFALSTVVFALACSAASNEGGSEGGTGSGAASGSGGGGGSGNGGGSGGLVGTGAGTGTGGGGGFAGNTCAGVSQVAANTLPVDVIWAIDTSCSMSEETAAVTAPFVEMDHFVA